MSKKEDVNFKTTKGTKIIMFRPIVLLVGIGV